MCDSPTELMKSKRKAPQKYIPLDSTLTHVNMRDVLIVGVYKTFIGPRSVTTGVCQAIHFH